MFFVIGIMQSGDGAVRIDHGDLGDLRGGDLLNDDDGVVDRLQDGPVVAHEFKGAAAAARVGALQESGKIGSREIPAG